MSFKEFTYRDILLNDIQNLERWRFAITQMTEELETLEAEYAAVKATNFDKMPTGSGDNLQEEKLLTAVAKKDELEKNLAFTKRRVADWERLIEQLDGEERKIVEIMVSRRSKNVSESLASELGYAQSQAFRIRSRALSHLAQLRYGAAYKP